MAMDIVEFGRLLLDTLDLDPVYVLLHYSELDYEQKQRWCLAYWMFYHTGAASYFSERSGCEFWDTCLVAAANTVGPMPDMPRWPRGKERRHFRGVASVNAVGELARRYPRPEDAVNDVAQHAPSFVNVRNAVTQWPLFGPWISFKVGDMLDRCLGHHVDFSEADIFVFDAPREAAEMWNRGRHPKPIQAAVEHLASHLGHYDAPPANDRKLTLQEYETILCKWKSHLNGHYPLGNDLLEVKHSLESFAPASETAAHLLSVHERYL